MAETKIVRQIWNITIEVEIKGNTHTIPSLIGQCKDFVLNPNRIGSY